MLMASRIRTLNIGDVSGHDHTMHNYIVVFLEHVKIFSYVSQAFSFDKVFRHSKYQYRSPILPVSDCEKCSAGDSDERIKAYYMNISCSPCYPSCGLLSMLKYDAGLCTDLERSREDEGRHRERGRERQRKRKGEKNLSLGLMAYAPESFKSCLLVQCYLILWLDLFTP